MKKITVGGQLYEWDGTRLSMNEALEMKDRTGLGIIGFELAAEALEPVALKWIAYLSKQRAGEKVDWDDFEFDLAAMLKDYLAGEPVEEPLDPTPPTSLSDEPKVGDTNSAEKA